MRWSVILLLLVMARLAHAGVLVEGVYEGASVKAEVGDDKTLVMVTVDGLARLVDLDAGTLAAFGGPARPPRLSDRPWNPDLRVEALGGGAMVAGQLGTYRLITEGPRICGEILGSDWMKPFLDPIARAMALVAREDVKLAPKIRYGCSPMGFELLSEQGWPLLVSGRDATIWQTRDLRFDHRSSFQRPSAAR